ncbi:HAMP domain-containing histidine kinase [Archangium violaceum]|uniref:sensor histidine kinase n=1 Tax=Archangium violaceum TaxID=83451 RepID=UPI0019506813|nr:HAMP domain-containing sensor histidine kinase [Archangium violaceum]QRN97187.1 HAMP domain-containing histidine kinase [Archangium violaceum]
MTLPTRWRRVVRESFKRWVRSQDTQEVLAASSLQAWLCSALAIPAVLALATWAPGAKHFFDLHFGKALACLLPALALGIGFGLRHRSRQRIDDEGWLHVLLGTAALQFFLAALMALAVMPGAMVFAAVLLFTTGYHGRLHRVAPTQPFLALGSAVALGLASLLAREESHVALFAVLGPLAIILELYSGTFALKHDQARAEAEQLRAAVQAHILEQQERDVGRLSQAMVQILGYNHDINNALMSASAAADILSVMGVQRNALPRAEFEELVRELNEGLTRIREMVLEIRQKGRRSVSSEPENVHIVPVLESVRTSVGWRFPDVHIQVKVEEQASHALVRGGITTLRRVVENLVLNACEGDGARGAGKVDILARPEPYSGRLELLIADDGPGFPPERLQAPIEGLSTTKPNGTGLGLYTSECLIRASGGTLERNNRPGGGAQLRILLPRELR